MTVEKTRVAIPKSKISMTILEFGEPLFAQFPEIPPIDVLRQLLRIVINGLECPHPRHADLGGAAPPREHETAVGRSRRSTLDRLRARRAHGAAS